MSKRKYKKGELVTSLDDLFRSDWFIVCYGNNQKTQHAGWLTSMQARCLYNYIASKMIYFAVPIENEKGEMKMEKEKIQPNDTVYHEPSGETWVVCGVDYEKGELIPCGYPFPTIARISDCRIIEKGYISRGGQPDGYIEALLERGLERFVDALSAQHYGLL